MKVPAFHGIRKSILCSKRSTIGPDSEPDNPIHTLPHNFLTIHFNIILRSLSLQRNLSHFDFSHRSFVFLISPVCVACPFHLNLLQVSSTLRGRSQWPCYLRNGMPSSARTLGLCIRIHSGHRCICFSACVALYKYRLCDGLNRPRPRPPRPRIPTK
jgi:hypothetical protein